MSASEEELELSNMNSVDSKLSSSPSYDIEGKSNGPSVDLSTSDGEENPAAFAEETLADAEWTAECERERNLRPKSSGLNCTEHITEPLDGCHLALFCFTKSTHFFLHLFASG